MWVHRFSSLFKPSRRVRRLVAVDETVLKFKDQFCYIWAAIDVDTSEILTVYASRGGGLSMLSSSLERYWINVKVSQS